MQVAMYARAIVLERAVVNLLLNRLAYPQHYAIHIFSGPRHRIPQCDINFKLKKTRSKYKKILLLHTHRTIRRTMTALTPHFLSFNTHYKFTEKKWPRFSLENNTIFHRHEYKRLESHKTSKWA